MKLVWILPRINTCTFRVLKRIEKETAVMQKHWFNLQSTSYFCTGVGVHGVSLKPFLWVTYMFNIWSPWTCLWNKNWETHITFRAQSWEGKAGSVGLLVPSPLDTSLGWEFSVKNNFRYILWDVWKVDSNKYIISCGRWIIQCLRTWTGE